MTESPFSQWRVAVPAATCQTGLSTRLWSSVALCCILLQSVQKFPQKCGKQSPGCSSVQQGISRAALSPPSTPTSHRAHLWAQPFLRTPWSTQPRGCKATRLAGEAETPNVGRPWRRSAAEMQFNALRASTHLGVQGRSRTAGGCRARPGLQPPLGCSAELMRLSGAQPCVTIEEVLLSPTPLLGLSASPENYPFLMLILSLMVCSRFGAWQLDESQFV